MDEFQMEVERVVMRTPEGERKRTRDEVAAVIAAGGDSFDGLLELIGNSAASAAVRATAGWLFERLGDARAIPALICALRDSAAEVRCQSALALGTLGGEQAFDALLSALDDSDDRVASVAASALGTLGDARAQPRLLGVLADRSRSSSRRGHAAESLVSVGDPTFAVPALIAALDDAEPEVRFWAAFALGQIGDERAVAPLERRSDDLAIVQGHSTVGDEVREALSCLRGQRDSD
ncbi:MAG TPA: HEAT repeat domain-containing protein [Casimicrobiaceae bacterium]|nr:HEAT repeat domain-containing protein [Casimicrobiaceae bacterium]